MKKVIEKRKSIGSWLLVHLGRWLISVLFSLNRVIVRGEEAFKQACAGRKPVFVGFWHGRMLYPIQYLRRYRTTAIVSPSRDGALLIHLLSTWGFEIIPGSSGQRGREALRQMVPVLSDPESILSTAIDGPVGPARIAKSGSLALAVKKGALLIPISGSASRHWTFWKSWDHFQLPKPFGRIVIQIGPPLEVSPDTDPEKVAEIMTHRANEVEQQADALTAHMD
ncbi:MAG: DUF374 domain-containing protein [Fidelibacterota bacterium]|nr:MAG: DUF374 domain-containing protein [Candidatus Neomarinimicrobiota bacterium]